MASTAENPSSFDPLDDMPADEPRFTLRGRDKQAPKVITYWSALTREAAIKLYGVEPKTQRDQRALEAVLLKCAAADDAALEIAEWQRGNAAQEGVRATYAGTRQTEEQIEALRAQRRTEALLREIQEGRYHLCEARDGLLALGLITEQQAGEMQRWLDNAQQIAESIDPRAQYREPTLPITEGG